MKNKIIKCLVVVIAVFSLSCTDVVVAEPEPFYSLGLSTEWKETGKSLIVVNSANLNITNVSSNDEFIAYKILDVLYDATSNTMSYDFTDDFKSFLTSSTAYKNLSIPDYMKLTSGDITSGSTITSSTLDKVVSLYANYIKTKSVTGTDMTTTGNTASATLMAGTYLILPKTTSKVYAVMVGNLQMEPTGVDNNWTLNDTSIVAKVSDVSIRRLVNGNDTITSVESFNNHNYTTIATLPKYPSNATNKTYVITDSTSNSNLSFDFSELTIYDGEIQLTKSSNGTYINSNGQVVVTVNTTNKQMTATVNIDNVLSNTLKFNYSGIIESNSIPFENMTSTSTLKYSNDPYSTGTTTINSTSNIYTTCFTIRLYDKNDHSKLLANGVFDLTDKTGKIFTQVTTSSMLTYASFIGTANNIYYLKQVKAPSGYRLINDTITLDLSSLDSGTKPCYVVELEAEETSALPFTGGSGTIIYSILGLVIVVTGVSGYVLYRRKNKK